MFVFILVMTVMGACINLSNYYVSEKQIRKVLDYMIEHEGQINRAKDKEEENSSRGNYLDEFSPEFALSARYFTATFSKEGKLSDIRTTHVSEYTRENASNYAETAYKRDTKYGRIGNFYFRSGLISDDNTMIVFLNCTSQIRSYYRILNLTLLVCVAGVFIAFLLVFIFSNRVIQPEIENVRRQKQFITNASHELKTPLAVIRANTEIEEMMNGESEWTQSTMRQVDRLDGLVQNLVMISRAAEQEDRSIMAEIDVSKNVEESVNAYRALAQQDKKELILRITPGIRMLADESKIRQLTTILVDNAFKYCDEEGTIRITLDTLRKGKTVRLIVANTFAEGATVDYSRYFERFYREDESHSVDRGGYGIGLSIAESICHQYGGSIQASWKNGDIYFTCLLT
jgi:signal transduction histidine kinase